VMQRGIGLACAGVVTGGALSLAAGRWLQTLLAGVHAHVDATAPVSGGRS